VPEEKNVSIDWSLNDDALQRAIERMAIPRSMLEGESNYSSAAATAATYGPSVLKSAADIMQMFKDSVGARVVSDSMLNRGAFLVVPPETLHQMKMDLVYAEVEEGPIRFGVFMDYGVRMPIHASALMSTCGDIGSWEPPYKPRPLPEPVQKVPAWQYVVAVAAGVMILSMMFSAVGAL
jgi:hypothetical protein